MKKIITILNVLFSIRKVMQTFLIEKTHCTQINGKLKRKVKLLQNHKAFSICSPNLLLERYKPTR